MRNNRRIVVLAFVVGLGQLTYSQAPTTSERDKAIRAVKACLHRNEVASRECQKVNENVEQLVAVYKSGDKSVLPLLFKFTYLTEFYDYALLNDGNGFLTALSALPAPERRAVAVGLADGDFKPLSKERFDEIRSVLRSKSDDPDLASIAAECLKELEDKNASLFLTYFPAGTFTSKAGVLQVRWYSGELHSLGELPLIPISNNEQVIYRFTYIPVFSTPKSLTLSVQPNGTGELKIASIQI